MKKIILGVFIGATVATSLLWAVSITRTDKSISIERLTMYSDGSAQADYQIYPVGNPEFAYRGNVAVDLSNKARILADCIAAIKSKEDIP